MFGRSSSTVTEPTEVVDAPAADVVTDDGEHTQRIMTARPSSRNRREPVVDEPVVVTPDETVVAPEPVVETVEPKRWAHVSAIASFSLVVGTLAVAATLTGVLAPLGFAAGVLALLLALIGVASVTRRHVTGHGLLTFGALFGVVAIVLSLLAMGNDLSWLSKDTNEVTVVHNWLNDHMHWLRRF
jgi:hypothetical protein